MERSEQLAHAYLKMARANHYMLGIVEKVTTDEHDEAEQHLIRWQNNSHETSPTWKRLELALDILEHDRRVAKLA